MEYVLDDSCCGDHPRSRYLETKEGHKFFKETDEYASHNGKR